MLAMASLLADLGDRLDGRLRIDPPGSDPPCWNALLKGQGADVRGLQEHALDCEELCIVFKTAPPHAWPPCDYSFFPLESLITELIWRHASKLHHLQASEFPIRWPCQEPVMRAAVPMAYIECSSKEDALHAVRFAVEHKVKIQGKGLD